MRGLLFTSTHETLHWQFLQFPLKDNGNFKFPDWLFKGNTAYPKNSIRSESDPLVEAVNITDVISKKAVQGQNPIGRESAVSARDLAPSSERYSQISLNEQQAVVLEQTKNTSTSQKNETITLLLTENVDVSTGEAPEVPDEAPEVLEKPTIWLMIRPRTQHEWFANDSYSCIPGVISRPEGAKLVISEMNNWCDLNGFILNQSKSSETFIPLTAQASLTTRDDVCGFLRTSSMKLLGMHVQYNLEFDTHIAENTARANRNLYLLTRLKQYGFSLKGAELLFFSLVLSVLTYGNNSLGWISLLEKIDTIQRRAKRFGIFSMGRAIEETTWTPEKQNDVFRWQRWILKW